MVFNGSLQQLFQAFVSTKKDRLEISAIQISLASTFTSYIFFIKMCLICTFVLMLDRVSDVSELAVFKDEEVVLLGQCLQFLAEGHCVVLLAKT